MNRKDIALTVGGVVATMALAYLFYRQQQNDAAAALAATQATSSQDVTDPNYYNDGDLYAQSMAYQLGSQVSSLSVPSLSSTTSSVDTSSTTAATGNEPTTDSNDMISQILAAFASGTTTTGTNQNQPTDFTGMAIPAAAVSPTVSITGIPTTANQATTEADDMLGVSGTTGGAVNPPSTTPVATTTAPAVHVNYIMSTQPGTTGGESPL